MKLATMGRPPAEARNSPDRRHIVFAAVAVAMAAGMLPPPAGGQEPERGVTVQERPRPDYHALGLRVGGFLVFPSIGTQLRHDDNIYRADEGETGDSVASLRPSVRAASQWSNHELVLEAAAEADRYRRLRNENSTDWFAQAAGRLDVTRRTHVRSDLRLERGHEDRGDPSAAAGAQPGTWVRGVAGVGASHRLNRLGFDAEARLVDLAYHAAPSKRRDRREFEVSVRAGYQLVSEYEAFVRAIRRDRRYDRRPRRYDRDSEGWELVAGTALDLGGIISGEVFAGYLAQSYDDPALRRIEGWTFGGSVDWNLTPLTTVSGLVRRSAEESVLAASGFLATHAEVRADHELLRNLLLRAGVQLTRNDYEAAAGAAGRNDEILRVSAGGTWLVNRRIHVDFGYRFATRESTVARDNYDAGIASASLRLQF